MTRSQVQVLDRPPSEVYTYHFINEVQAECRYNDEACPALTCIVRGILVRGPWFESTQAPPFGLKQLYALAFNTELRTTIMVHMDPKRHKLAVSVISIIFVFAVLTNVLMIHPDVLRLSLVGLGIIVLVGVGVWSVRRYKRRFY